MPGLRPISSLLIACRVQRHTLGSPRADPPPEDHGHHKAWKTNPSSTIGFLNGKRMDSRGKREGKADIQSADNVYVRILLSMKEEKNFLTWPDKTAAFAHPRRRHCLLYRRAGLEDDHSFSAG